MDDLRFMLTIDCRYEFGIPQTKYLMVKPEHSNLVADFFDVPRTQGSLYGVLSFYHRPNGDICAILDDWDNCYKGEMLCKVVTVDEVIPFAVELRVGNDQVFKK